MRNDIYKVTIAAMMTREISPTHLNYSIKMCYTSFVLQLLMSALYYYEFSSLDDFQPFTMKQTALRIICSMLLHLMLYEEIEDAF